MLYMWNLHSVIYQFYLNKIFLVNFSVFPSHKGKKKSPWELLKLLPRLCPRWSKSESLWVRPRHGYFIKLPWIVPTGSQVWEPESRAWGSQSEVPTEAGLWTSQSHTVQSGEDSGKLDSIRPVYRFSTCKRWIHCSGLMKHSCEPDFTQGTLVWKPCLRSYHLGGPGRFLE